MIPLRKNFIRYNTWNVRCSDLFGLNAVKDRVAITCVLAPSPLSNHILSVISFSSQKQVVRSDAGRVITMVQYKQPVGDGAMANLPRYAVRQHLLFPVIGKVKPSVASSDLAAPPGPTLLVRVIARHHIYAPPKFRKVIAPTRTVSRTVRISCGTRATAKLWNRTQPSGSIKYRRAYGAFIFNSIVSILSVSQGVNLHTQGLALVRLVRLRQQALGPFVFYHGE